jgi:hypothetical protein
MAYKVFISASSKDADLVDHLARRLKDSGIEVTSTRRSRKLSKLDEEFHHLRQADEVIVFLTDKSLDSKWVLLEMGAALSLDKRVTPILAGVDKRELSPLLKGIESVRYADLDRYLSKLEKRAKSEGSVPSATVTH